MFEKEAEEYVINAGIEKANDFVVYKIKVGENAWSLIVESKEELSCTDWIKIYEGSEEACHKFVDWRNGAEFGYNKANEWHKPSEKLPEECSLVLAFGFEDTEPSLYYFVDSDCWEWMPRRIASLSNDQIRLWKEIVLPKEIG